MERDVATAAAVAAAAASGMPALVSAAPPPLVTVESVPEDNYDISSMHSGDSTDDEEKPRRPVPAWAKGPALKAALYHQFLSTVDPTAIFPVLSPPNLSKIFDNKSKPR